MSGAVTYKIRGSSYLHMMPPIVAEGRTALLLRFVNAQSGHLRRNEVIYRSSSCGVTPSRGMCGLGSV